MLFKTVCDEYHLIPEENYTVPPEAEGLVVKKEEGPEAKSLLPKQDKETKAGSEEDEDKTMLSTGATTRRHKQTPSIGTSFMTIQEGDEDDREPEGLPKEGHQVLSSSVERVPVASEPAPKEASTETLSEAAEKKESTPEAADPSTQTTNEKVEEPEATEAVEPKAEGEDEEERPTTAVPDKQRPSIETAMTEVKIEDSEETPEKETTM